MLAARAPRRPAAPSRRAAPRRRWRRRSWAARPIARTCMRVISGWVMPTRQPRWPSIGLASRAARRCAGGWPPPATRWRPASSAICSSPCRHELVQRRIEQPDHHRQAGHGLRGCRGNRRSGKARAGPARPSRSAASPAQDHPPHGEDASLAEKHVLGAAEADAARAEAAGERGVFGAVGVGAHAQPGHSRRRSAGRCPARRVSSSSAGDQRQRAHPQPAQVAVDRDGVAFAQHHLAGPHHAGGAIDLELVAAHHAGLAPAAGDQRGVGGHAAFGGDHRHRRVHAVHVFGAGFGAHQDRRHGRRRPAPGPFRRSGRSRRRRRPGRPAARWRTERAGRRPRRRRSAGAAVRRAAPG